MKPAQMSTELTVAADHTQYAQAAFRTADENLLILANGHPCAAV